MYKLENIVIGLYSKFKICIINNKLLNVYKFLRNNKIFKVWLKKILRLLR